MRCQECGGEYRNSSEPIIYRVHGEDITVEGIEHRVCDGCGDELLSLKNTSALQRRANDEYRTRHGFLSGEEIKAIRTSFNATQEEFQRVIRSGPKSMTRWEKGTVLQTGVTDTLLRVLRRFPMAYHWLEIEISDASFEQDTKSAMCN